MEDIKKVAIVGVGLIGGSLGLALKESFKKLTVYGVTRGKESLELALKMRAIDKGTFSLKEASSEADIVFVATPVGFIVDIIKQIYPHLKEGAIITDVGSTKSRIVHRVEAFLPKTLHFIGGHPLTGSEQQGVAAATSKLFKNFFYFLTPTPRTDTPSFKKLHYLLTHIGAQVLAIDPDKHDRLMAAVSHLPHILSSHLVRLAQEQTKELESSLLLTAGSFRDMTRIAASPPELWLDVCLENDHAILEALEKFEAQIKDFGRLLRRKKKEALAERFRQAQEIRMNLPLPDVKRKAELWELSVPVEDKSGVISEITLSIGGLGINIEDLEIVPLTPESGLLKLIIAKKKNARLVLETLKEKGFEGEIKPYHA